MVDIDNCLSYYTKENNQKHTNQNELRNLAALLKNSDLPKSWPDIKKGFLKIQPMSCEQSRGLILNIMLL